MIAVVIAAFTVMTMVMMIAACLSRARLSVASSWSWVTKPRVESSATSTAASACDAGILVLRSARTPASPYTDHPIGLSVCLVCEREAQSVVRSAIGSAASLRARAGWCREVSVPRGIGCQSGSESVGMVVETVKIG